MVSAETFSSPAQLAQQMQPHASLHGLHVSMAVLQGAKHVVVTRASPAPLVAVGLQARRSPRDDTFAGPCLRHSEAQAQQNTRNIMASPRVTAPAVPPDCDLEMFINFVEPTVQQVAAQGVLTPRLNLTGAAHLAASLWAALPPFIQQVPRLFSLG
jgi:hypothetical protein